MNSQLANAKRLVVKVGSSLVTNRGEGLDRGALGRWARQIAELREAGRQVILVSSGAIAEGMQRLGWKRRQHALHELQAAAARKSIAAATVRVRVQNAAAFTRDPPKRRYLLSVLILGNAPSLVL